jgi:hypothetical protein
MSKQTIQNKTKKNSNKCTSGKHINNVRVPYEYRQLFQDYLRKLFLFGGLLESLDVNKITMTDSSKPIAMETIAENESFYIGITYVGRHLRFLFCFGENKWYIIKNRKNGKDSLRKIRNEANIYLRVDDIKLVFYPDPTDKTCRLANFRIVIENGLFRLEEIDDNK